MKGKYIVIEGHDGVGKTTQGELLTNYLRQNGKKVAHINEPGGLLSGDLMRILVKNREFDLDGISNLLIFTANRRELWEKVIKPELAKGTYVIADRNWWSTLAYQHYGQGVSKKTIVDVTKATLPKRYIVPDVGLIMNLRPSVRLRRMKNRAGKVNKDAFESLTSDFQQRVEEGYLKTAKEFNIPIIDASPSPEKIHQEILKLII